MKQLLSALMNDHLAGAVAAITLARDWQQRCEGSEAAAVIAEVTQQIEEDRHALERMMEDLGIERSRAKQAMGWISEHFVEARLKAVDKRDAAAGFVFLLQTLMIGIHGKALLWEALQAIQPHTPALAGYDYPRLSERADQQQQLLRRHHAAAAVAAFATDMT